MEDSYTSIKFYSNIDLETNFIVCNVRLSLVNFVTGETIIIGSANLHLINTAFYNSWDSIIDHADGISGDLYVITQAIHRWLVDEKELLTDGKIAILDEIEINKEYRNKGFGKELIDKITSYLTLLSFDYIAVCPAPFEIARERELEWKTQQDKLIGFYMNLGFELMSDINEDVVMGKRCL